MTGRDETRYGIHGRKQHDAKHLLRFTPTKSDYTKGSRYLIVSGRWIWLTLIGAEPFGLCYIVGFPVLRPGESSFLWIYLPPAPMIAVFLLVWVPMSAGRQAGKQERLTCEMTWHVDDGAILIQNKFGEMRMDWGSFQWFKETKGFFFLVYTTNRNMAQAVPKRASESSEQEAAFREILRRNIKGTTAGAQPKTTPA